MAHLSLSMNYEQQKQQQQRKDCLRESSVALPIEPFGFLHLVQEVQKKFIEVLAYRTFV